MFQGRTGEAGPTEGGEEVEEEVVEGPEGDGSAECAGGVHRPASVGALGEDASANREADGEGRGILGGARLVDGRGEDGEDEEESADELKEEDLRAPACGHYNNSQRSVVVSHDIISCLGGGQVGIGEGEPRSGKKGFRGLG